MNSTNLYKTFYFNLLQFQKFHTYDCTKGTGAATNYIAKMIHGKGTIRAKHQTLYISEGDIFYIPQGLKYQSFWQADEHNHISWFSFGFDAFLTPNNYSLPLQKIECNEKAKKLIDELCEDITVSYSSVGLLYQFMGEASKTMQKDYHPYSRITEKALEFMQKTAEYTMRDVAEYCGVSESGLYPIFQKVFKKSPLEMKQEILCEKAVQLLTTTDLPVETISNRLLFSSSSYFRKILKKHTGKTPREIRKDAFF